LSRALGSLFGGPMGSLIIVIGVFCLIAFAVFIYRKVTNVG